MIGSRDFIAIVGPTASGKSQLAMRLATQINGEIIACDSVQIYRGFDIGSNKPTRQQQQLIPHHLLDLVNWSEDFDAERYRQLARQTIRAIVDRGKMPIVVGGCGLYFRALLGNSWHGNLPHDHRLRAELSNLDNGQLFERLQQLDHQRAQQIHRHDRLRLVRATEIAMLTGKKFSELPDSDRFELTPYTIYLRPARASLCLEIERRTHQHLNDGLVAEVQRLQAQGCDVSRKPFRSIGYQQVADYLDCEAGRYHELVARIVQATRQYAKRQTTWFNKVAYDICLNSIDEFDNDVAG